MTTQVLAEVTVQAPARRVYELFTEPSLLVRWMAEDAQVEPRPGGAWQWRMANGDVCSGHFLELDPPHRLVFTYGWERVGIAIPPGSTTVEVTLEEQAGMTTVRVRHTGLDTAAAGRHRGGWRHYLKRLALLAEGATVGPDELAGWRADGTPAPRPLPR